MAETVSDHLQQCDPIMRGGDRYMQGRIPGAKGQPHVTLTGGHFLQEDSPVQFARAINTLLARMLPVFSPISANKSDAYVSGWTLTRLSQSA
jgi:hypothetical protein